MAWRRNEVVRVLLDDLQSTSFYRKASSRPAVHARALSDGITGSLVPNAGGFFGLELRGCCGESARSLG